MRYCPHGVFVLAGLAIAACDVTAVTSDTSGNDGSGQTYNHDGGLLSGGAQWPAGTHVLSGGLDVENGVLEVAPCSVIELPAGAGIDVRNGGALKLQGTASCPIRITSAKGSPMAGDWDTIDLYASADGGNNVLDWVIIEYGGSSGYGALWVESGASFAMTNSTVAHNMGAGVQLGDGVTVRGFSGNTLTDNGNTGIDMYADQVGRLDAGTYGPNTVEGILVRGGTVEHTQTWKALGTPYILASNVSITNAASAATLAISPGVTIELAPGTGINVHDNGAILANGTAVAPITFTSTKAAPARGDWDEIDLYQGSAPSQFDYVTVEYGGSASQWGLLWLDTGAAASVTNSTFRHGGAFGVDVEDGATLSAFSGNTLQDNAYGPIRVSANGIGMLDAGTYWPNDVDAVQVVGSAASRNATWHDLGVPYDLLGTVRIEAAAGSAHVTVDAGTVIQMASGGILRVGNLGGLTLNGTSTARVVITSAQPVPSSGSWDEIDIYASSVSAYNVFTYADISYGGGAGYGQLWLETNAGVTLDNVRFAAAATCDVYFAQVTAPPGFSATSSSYTLCR